MTQPTEDLINDLKARTEAIKKFVEDLRSRSDKELNWKASDLEWSVLECVEHLKRYCDFYNPEIRNRIANSRHSSTSNFKSGMLGNYFAEMMLPKQKLNKMKTLKSMNPAGSRLPATILEEFITQQTELIELLDQARAVDLNKTKTSISISNFLKLKLGDTFRVVIYHEQRHLEQIKKVLKLIPSYAEKATLEA